MPKFAANLHYLFTELPFLDRFAAAADAGFKAVEFQIPYDHPPKELKRRLGTYGLKMALFDTPMGNWNAGDRGMAAIPGREEEFRSGLPRALEYAEALECDLVHVVCGVIGAGVDLVQAERVYVDNLRHATQLFRRHGVRAVIEPINRTLANVQGYITEGVHGYFLNYTDQAVRFIEQVGTDNLFLHLDVYHMQLMEGHLAATLRSQIGRLRHVQIAGVPGRHEPSMGEINYSFLFNLLDELDFQGWVGCEYRPLGKTLDGLGWAAHYGIGAQGVATAS